jgi:hypothetical protein
VQLEGDTKGAEDVYQHVLNKIKGSGKADEKWRIKMVEQYSLCPFFVESGFAVARLLAHPHRNRQSKN